MMVYIDGVVFGNGKVGVCGGVGVWFGVDDLCNVLECFVGLL